MFLNNSLTTYKERFLNTPFYRLIMDIEAKIQALPKEQRALFRKKLLDRLYYRRWCNMHGIDYVNPERDMQKAKEALYSELVQQGLIQSPQAYSSQQSEVRLE